MHITSTQLKSFYSGLILSDATIDKGVHKRALRITLIEKQFIDYIENFTNQYTNFFTYIKQKDAYIDKNNVKHKETWCLNIKAHPYFNKIYSLYYNDYRKKYINKEILHSLDLRGLANMYMGDGYITLVGKTKNNIKNRRVQFATDCFSKKDNELFAQWLTHKFGYETSIIKRGNFYRTQIMLKSAQNFFMDIKEYILPCYYYKLNMVFETKPLWMRNDYFDFMIGLNSTSFPLYNNMCVIK